ncbi:MAG: VCBS repeat-containing protein [Bacteroidetes bacterium]|nr:VCBS repeat-containing protein [Bacteroidota bacterium]MCW5894362.1 VCBS repeat-containing protein [Bacteroidota bacterium]
MIALRNLLRYSHFATRHGLIVVMATILMNAAVAQWTTQSPVPTHLDVRGVGAPTPQRVFIATDDNFFDNGGALFESSDGGTAWIQRDIPVSLANPLNGLFFLDSQNGWAYGNENYRTTDGGTTWTQLPFLGSTYFMKFYTSTFGLATGNGGGYISTDGGNSWNPSPNGMSAFDFADDQIGVGVADSMVFRTTNGGTTFSLVHIGPARDVVFLSGTVAVGVGGGGFIRSTNVGVSWTPGAASIGRTRLLRVSTDVVLAWGRTGGFPNYDDRILRSTDAGQTWTDLGEVVPAGVFAIAAVDPQNVVASDYNGNMFRSGDAGLNWVQTFTSPGPSPSFLSSATLAFANAQTGFFGYGAGFVIKTTDGGATWFQISSGTGNALQDIARFPDGNMIAVGENGTLLTSNGISPWILRESFTQLDIAAIDIINATDAVVVDQSGQVYKSSDAGATWMAAPAKPSNLSAARDVRFTTLLDGWVIGQSFSTGALYHTTNGGTTWTPVPDFLGGYVAVDVEGSNIWAANVGGRFYRSTNSGGTWIQGDLPESPLLIGDMDFFDENIGYAVGAWGRAFRTEDGGSTWQALPMPNSTDNFTDIHLLGPNEFWLSTNTNAAYYTATGGHNWAVLNIGSAGFGSFAAIAASPSGSAWVVGDQGYIEYFAGPPPPPLNRPPEASFTFITSGMTVQFTDTSVDPDGIVIGWFWQFGDGTTSTERHPTHTFTDPNSYIVRLTVTDDDSATGSRGRIVVVQPNPGGTFGNFTEVTPLDSLFVTNQDEDFWVITTAPADFDGDGDMDIAVLGWYVIYNQSVEDRLILLRNDGLGTEGRWAFTHISVPLGNLTAGSSDLAWGDVDGDGDQDLVVGTDGQTVIFRNDAGTLVLTDTELPPYWEYNDQADFDLRSITLADYDNDGDLDLLIPSVFEAGRYRTALMRNDGPNGTGGWIFTETDSVFAPTTHAQSMWADFDGDLDLDLLLVNIAPLTDYGFIRRYRNDGNGVFVAEDVLGPLTIEHGEAQWGDYDADGDLDILVAGNLKEVGGTYTARALRIYRNTNDTYDSLDVIPCIPCEGWFDMTAATWADYDNDGDMDILLAGTYNPGSQIDGRARVYLNTGGVFADTGGTLPAPRASGDRGGTFSWFDLDGDGDLDYFIAGQYFVPGGNGLVEAQMHVYRNDAPGQNAPPSRPTNLGAAMHDSLTVTLTWTASSDDHTPSVALTYDLQLFRNGVPIALPRSLPQPGNVSAGTEWLLTGLPQGQYRWALRAIDAAYAGSETATGEFVIGGPTTVGTEDNLPRSFALEQNYPNPFNPSTTIEFALPHTNFVTLTLYNILGQEVRTLVSERMDAGTYQVQFNAGGLPSGAYIYRLHAGGFVQTRKLLLLK